MLERFRLKGFKCWACWGGKSPTFWNVVDVQLPEASSGQQEPGRNYCDFQATRNVARDHFRSLLYWSVLTFIPLMACSGPHAAEGLRLR